MATARLMSLLCVTTALVLTPATAWADDADPTPPAAVLASLQPGGTGFEDAVRLGATNESGDVDVRTRDALRDSASFGTPRGYFYYWEPTSKESTAERFTDADFSLDPGEMWLSVELQSGTPWSMIALENDGTIMGVGGWTPTELTAIDALPADSIIVTDGRYGEAYAISGDHRTISSLNDAGSALLVAAAADAPTFRQLKAQQASMLVHENGPPDAVGGGPSSPNASSDGVLLAIAILAGVALLAWVESIVRRRRPHRPVLRSENDAV